eukprot:5008214-Alexandrium_andersonii.AAC.1
MPAMQRAPSHDGGVSALRSPETVGLRRVRTRPQPGGPTGRQASLLATMSPAARADPANGHAHARAR